MVLYIAFSTLNDTHMEKLFFIRLNTRMAGRLLVTFLICLYNQFLLFLYAIKFHYTLYYHVLRVQMLEKCDSSNTHTK